VRYLSRALLRHKLGLTGALIAFVLLVVALGAPFLAGADPLAMHMTNTLRPPSWAHLLGTDQFGRDEMARVLYGTRLSFAVGFVSMFLATAVGVPIGAVSGYTGGLWDAIAMRWMDALLAFPAVLLAIGLVAILGPSTASGIVAISIVYLPLVARVVRGSVLVRRGEEFVEAARAVGNAEWRILLRHILPNSFGPLLVQLTVGFAGAIVIQAGLSFLGAGTPPPTPSWGVMLNEARPYMVTAPHVAVFPGLAISLAVLGFNLLGDGMRDILDPRLEG
jgi:ABC-type dipeptide/oligopeptide/nickel transport system permease subunit